MTEAVTQITGIAEFPAGTTGDLNGASVRLFTYENQINWATGETVESGTIAVSGRKVPFNLTGFPPGEYILDIWKDNDNDRVWASTGDYCGVYGHLDFTVPNFNVLAGSHFKPTKFQISEDETVRLDITVYLAPTGINI